jgi:mannosyltransferase
MDQTLHETLPTRPASRALARTPLILAALTLFAFILRLYLLGEKSIWLDEAFSIALARHDLGDLLRLTASSDTHPPLYYIVLHFWLALGESEAMVRLLSALFSAAAVPLMFVVGRELYDEGGAGLLAAAVLAFSPFQIWYAQETRMYALLTFLVLASAAFFIRALRGRGRPAVQWAGFVVASALALYTDNGAIWYLGAIALFFLTSRRRFGALMRPWLLSQVAIGLLYLPWLPSFWQQMQQVTANFWLPAPTFRTILDALLDFNSLNLPSVALGTLFMTVIFIWAYVVPGPSWQRRLTTMWLLVPLIVAALLSLRQPIFLSRNLIAASLGYYLLVAGTIHKFDSPRVTAALLMPLLAMNLLSLNHNLWVEQKEPWRDVAALVAETEPPEGTESLLLFVPGYAELPFSYYYAQSGRPAHTQGYPVDDILLHDEPRTVEDLDTLLADAPHVWLIMRDFEAVDPDGAVKAWLDSNSYRRGPDFESEEVTAISYTRWDFAQNDTTFLPAVMQGELVEEAPGE